MQVLLPPRWEAVLASDLEKPYFKKLADFVDSERSEYEVYPPEHDVFNAFRLCEYDQANVLILGQDPYHDKNQAHGLCFSVRPGVKLPPSLLNIFKERLNDIGLPIPSTGYLAPWASQGILMINAVMTVRAHEANSHKGKGWETFTDHVIRELNNKESQVVFVLWGGSAQKKKGLIDTAKHIIIESAHPSPLSAHNGFFGSRPFSKINEALISVNHQPIDWRLPEDIN